MHILNENLRSDAQRNNCVYLRFSARFSSKLHYSNNLLSLRKAEIK